MRRVVSLGLLALLLAGCGRAPEPVRGQVDLAKALSDVSGDFAPVTPGRTFHFPEDHGEHPGYKTEWWYVTGNLSDEEGRSYGYQLTFFSTGLPTPATPADSPWTASRVMMGHLAVSDPSESKFRSYERFSRRALDLAGVRNGKDGLEVWLEDWSLARAQNGRWTLRASEGGSGSEKVELELELREDKPPVLQGDGGYSRKGPEPQYSSYYVSLTRLSTSGALTLGERRMKVSGSSWFDHEWSSQALAPGLVGWDWFSLQLDDGWELMIYLLRYADGRLEPASSGVLIDPQGRSGNLGLEDFQMRVTDRYRSRNGVEYPSSWQLEVPSRRLTLRVTPLMQDQEMKSSVPYWEGAVKIKGTREGQPIGGKGFVELTGYDKTQSVTRGPSKAPRRRL